MVEDGTFLHLTCKPLITIKASDDTHTTILETIFESPDKTTLQIDQDLVFPYVFSKLYKQEIVAAIWGWQNGIWNPGGLPTSVNDKNKITFRDTTDGSAESASLFGIISRFDDPYEYGPLLATEVGLVVQKDFSAGGFVCSNQGALFLNSGLHWQCDPPQIVLGHSGREILTAIDHLSSEPPTAVQKQLYINTNNSHLWEYHIAGYDGPTAHWHDKGHISNYSGNFDTLYLRKFFTGDPAHLDLGNLTVHGSLNLEDAALQALFSTAAFTAAFTSALAGSVVGGALAYVGGLLSTNPQASTTFAGLTLEGAMTLNGNHAIAPATDSNWTVGDAAHMLYGVYTNPVIVGNYTAHPSSYITMSSVDSGGDAGLILNFNTSSDHGAIVPDATNPSPSKTLNLGDATHKWANIYCNTLSAAAISGVTNPLTITTAYAPQLTIAASNASVQFHTDCNIYRTNKTIQGVNYTILETCFSIPVDGCFRVVVFIL